MNYVSGGLIHKAFSAKHPVTELTELMCVIHSWVILVSICRATLAFPFRLFVLLKITLISE